MKYQLISTDLKKGTSKLEASCPTISECKNMMKRKFEDYKNKYKGDKLPKGEGLKKANTELVYSDRIWNIYKKI